MKESKKMELQIYQSENNTDKKVNNVSQMTNKHIKIYYAEFNEQFNEQIYSDYLHQLPNYVQQEIIKYRRWQDKYSHLLGKLMLLDGLRNYGYPHNVLDRINYDQYSRPFIDGDIDFNISHSGQYVLCAIGRNVKLGIDIEKIKKINFDDFKEVMTEEQWKNILHSEDPIRSFFKYWTIKESVIKAEGRGLSIPLLDIHVNNNVVLYEDKLWYLKNLTFNNQYCATLANNKQDITVEQICIDFYK